MVSSERLTRWRDPFSHSFMCFVASLSLLLHGLLHWAAPWNGRGHSKESNPRKSEGQCPIQKLESFYNPISEITSHHFESKHIERVRTLHNGLLVGIEAHWWITWNLPTTDLLTPHLPSKYTTEVIERGKIQSLLFCNETRNISCYGKYEKLALPL